MPLRLLAFAQAAEQLGFRERVVEADPRDTLRTLLIRAAPALDLQAMRFAVDGEYHDLDTALGEAREIAIIPPVSGG